MPAPGPAIWAEHVPAVRAFLSIQTQWRGLALADGSTRWIGLDYAAARAGLELSGQTVPPEVWEGVRIIEIAACSALNARN